MFLVSPPTVTLPSDWILFLLFRSFPTFTSSAPYTSSLESKFPFISNDFSEIICPVLFVSLSIVILPFAYIVLLFVVFPVIFISLA